MDMPEDDWDGFRRDDPENSGKRFRSSATISLSPIRSGLSGASKKRPQNAVLIKLNQIGTVTETKKSHRSCKENQAGERWSHTGVGRRATRSSLNLTVRSFMRADQGPVLPAVVSGLRSNNQIMRIAEILDNSAPYAGIKTFQSHI